MSTTTFDRRTGEVVEVAPCPDCRDARQELMRLEDIITGLQRDIRGWAMRYRDLERDKGAEAREHELWPVGERIFREWRKLCRHPRSAWTPDRFWAIEPFLTNPKYAPKLEDRILLCRRAVAGAAHDAYEVKRKNQSTKRFDEWERIFESAGRFEEFCNRAPVGWGPS